MFLYVVILYIVGWYLFGFYLGIIFSYFSIVRTKYHDHHSLPKKVFDLGSQFLRVVEYVDIMSGCMAASRHGTEQQLRVYLLR